MRRLGIAAMSIMVGLALFIGWYYIAANYDYSALAGTYAMSIQGESCLLNLHSDQTFTEQVTRSGRTQTVAGTWDRSGEAGVSFSGWVITFPSGQTSRSAQVYGQFGKTFGLWPWLSLGDGPVFRRRPFGTRF